MIVIPSVVTEQLSGALGEAVVRMWARLPHAVQHDLFEEAVTSRGENIRPQLAVFLHEKHPRTAAPIIERTILEPDSLGGLVTQEPRRGRAVLSTIAVRSGQSRRFRDVRDESASPPKADLRSTNL